MNIHGGFVNDLRTTTSVVLGNATSTTFLGFKHYTETNHISYHIFSLLSLCNLIVHSLGLGGWVRRVNGKKNIEGNNINRKRRRRMGRELKEGKKE